MKRKFMSFFLALVMLVGTVTPVLALENSKTMSQDEKIQWLQEEKILEGRKIFRDGEEKTDLALEENITRAEISKLLVHVLNVQDLAKSLTGKDTSFSDVKSDHWASGYIAALTNLDKDVAYGRKIMRGYEDGSFRPENKVTYAELAVMLVRVSKADLEADDEELANAAENWPKQWIDWAKALGLFQGVEVEDYNQPATRDLALVMIYNGINISLDQSKDETITDKKTSRPYNDSFLSYKRAEELRKWKERDEGRTPIQSDTNYLDKEPNSTDLDGALEKLENLLEAVSKAELAIAQLENKIVELEKKIAELEGEELDKEELDKEVAVEKIGVVSRVQAGKVQLNQDMDMIYKIADRTAWEDLYVNLGGDIIGSLVRLTANKYGDIIQLNILGNAGKAFGEDKQNIAEDIKNPSWLSVADYTASGKASINIDYKQGKINIDGVEAEIVGGTRLFIADVRKNALKEVKSIDEVFGTYLSAERLYDDVYMGYDEIDENTNEAKVIVFGKVDKYEDNSVIIRITRTDSYYKFEAEDTRGKVAVYDGSNTPIFPHRNLFDIKDVVEIGLDKYNGYPREILIDYSKDSVYEVVEVKDREIRLKDVSNNEKAFLMSRNVKVFLESQLKEGAHVQISIGDENQEVEIISVVDKELKGSL